MPIGTLKGTDQEQTTHVKGIKKSPLVVATRLNLGSRRMS
jgi:hypothetical protein